MRLKAGAVGGVAQRADQREILDLVAAPAFLAQQQHALVRMVEMLAARIGVAALDLVQEAVLEQEVERPVDGRRRDRLAFAAGQRLDDRIGAERGRVFAEDREDRLTQRRQLQALGARRPASTCRIQLVGDASSLCACMESPLRTNGIEARAAHPGTLAQKWRGVLRSALL